MKTKEEIENLAEKAIPLSNENIDYVEFANHDRKHWVSGYIQCQKDMVDKKYTEVDLENAFNSGRGYGVPDNIKDFNSFINSLNKQD